MSRFTFTSIEPGDARDATVVGAAFDAFETSSTSVSAANFADEGLTESSFAADSAQGDLSKQTVNVSTTWSQPFTVGWSQLVLNGTAYRITTGALDAAAYMRVVTHLDVLWDPGAYAAGVSVRVMFRHVLAPGGAGAAKIAASEWKRQWLWGAGPNGDNSSPPAVLVSSPKQGQGCTVDLESWIPGSLAGGTYVETQYQYIATDATAQVFVERGLMWVDTYPRVEVM